MRHYGWLIDPVSGDYVVENGDPVRDESLKFPAYARMRIQRGSWLYAPDVRYGSDFATIRKQTKNARSLLVAVGERALQPLIDDGRAESIVFDNVHSERFYEGLSCSITDVNGDQIDVELNPVGM